jgi:hypothetical protein
MAAASLSIRHYEGRFFWVGPAVQVTDLQDALSCTKLTLPGLKAQGFLDQSVDLLVDAATSE